jgi:hypothetical protein
MNNRDCVKYNPSFFDLFIPQYQILFNLCVSYDKTKLIIMSVIRLCLFIFILKFMNIKKIITFDLQKTFHTALTIVLFSYIFFNVIFIIMILIKKPIFDKDQIENNTNMVAKTLVDNKITKTY